MLDSIRRAFRVEPVTLAVYESGLRIAESRKLAGFDSLLLSSALLAGCSTFWSEGMRDGRFHDRRLTIRNPFA